MILGLALSDWTGMVSAKCAHAGRETNKSTFIGFFPAEPTRSFQSFQLSCSCLAKKVFSETILRRYIPFTSRCFGYKTSRISLRKRMCRHVSGRFLFGSPIIEDIALILIRGEGGPRKDVRWAICFGEIHGPSMANVSDEKALISQNETG